MITVQPAINAIRAIPGFGDDDALLIARAMLVRISANTPAGEALLDLCESLQAIVENDALELAADAYRRSAFYRQDMRNEAVARGA